MTARRERRELSRHNARWLAAVRKSDLPLETQLFAEKLARAANSDGTIADPEIIAVLHELDAEQS